MPCSVRPKAVPGHAVADALGEVDHVLVPDVGRNGVDEDQVKLVEIDRVLPVDARVAGPEDHPATSRVDQPSMLVVGLICQGGGYLVNADTVQVQHPVRLGPEQAAGTRGSGTPVVRDSRRCDAPLVHSVSVSRMRVLVADLSQEPVEGRELCGAESGEDDGVRVEIGELVANPHAARR